jgi:hypothetical protein
MTWLLAGAAFYAFALLFALSLCRAAADGDRRMHDAWERRDKS